GRTMRRRDFLTFLSGAAASSIQQPRTARAQPKIRRLGVLSQGSASTHPTAMFSAFQQGLRDLGWVEGHNLAIDWRFSEGRAEPLPKLAAERVGLPLELMDIGISNPEQLNEETRSAARAGVAAVVLIDDPVIASYRPQIVSLVSEAALPLFSIYSEYTDEGGLMAYGPSLQAIYWRGATYVDRILRGAKPSDLPVEQPTVFELVVNLTTAKALGLELPPTLLARANRVIE